MGLQAGPSIRYSALCEEVELDAIGIRGHLQYAAMIMADLKCFAWGM